MTTHETAVLKYLIENPSEIESVSATLSADMFSTKAGAEIFLVLTELSSFGIKPDLVSIVDSLRARGVLHQIGGESAVVEIITALPVSDNIDYYVRRVIDSAKRRKLKELAAAIASASNSSDDINVICSTFVDKLMSLSESKDDQLTSIKDASMGFLKSIEQGHVPRLIPTFIEPLDSLMGQMRPGELIIVAARPSVGKTAFAVNIARLMAINGLGVAMFSIEMPTEQILKRLLVLETGFSMNTLDLISKHDKRFDDVVLAGDRVASYNIFISDSPVVSANSIFKAVKTCRDVSAVIVDYLQLMVGTKKHYDTRTQEVAAISHGLKILARKLDVPVIALSQLNRNIEMRGPGSKPILADLRESGAIEQDADRVIFLHRLQEEGEIFAPQSDSEKLLISVAKNRNGPTGDIVVKFDRRTMRICDV